MLISYLKCRHCGRELPSQKASRGGRARQFCRDSCRVMFAYRKKLGYVTNRQRHLRMFSRHVGEYVPPTISDLQAVWLAAMLDAEGHLSLQLNRPRGVYFAQVGISNTNDLIIGRVRDIVGEPHTVTRVRQPSPTCKPIKTIFVLRVGLLDVLKAVRPHLVAKTKQADILMAFIELQDSLRVRTAVPPEFGSWHADMRELNRRGVAT